MSAKEKLIKEYKNNSYLAPYKLDEKNILNAVFYATEQEKCAQCQGLSTCQATVKGMKSLFDGSNLSYEACPYLIRERYSLNVNSKFSSNYLQNACLSDFRLDSLSRKKCFEYAKAFLSSDKKELPKGLYIYGPFGTGKTYFLSALANELAQKGIKTIIVFMPDLSRDLKNAMAKDGLEEKVLALKEADVLMLDDLGGEMISSWLRDEILAPIIQYRIVQNKPVFISSNMDYEMLKDHFKETRDDSDGLKAGRLLERINQLTKRVCFGKE